jgi:glycosyltransferase involved in cell wall biosynthesis
MKVLIYERKYKLKNIGGPQGYLYNIHEYLKDNPKDEICFLPDWYFKKTLTDYACRGSVLFIIRMISNCCKKTGWIKFLLTIFTDFFIKRHHSKEALEFYNQFDFIHVHISSLILSDFYKGSGIRAKVLLTSHCPEPLIDELGNTYCPGFLERHPRLRDFFLEREALAYDFCDKIMFPVPQAREPYIQSSIIFKRKFEQLQNKFFYLPTALNNIDPDKTNNRVLERLNLCPENLKVCYIGRHTNIKGYDFLKRAAVEAWKFNPTIHFIIGGKEEPIKGLQDLRWHELGWVHTPSLLNEVDVFVLPNKNTYFDLILLEALRQGIPVLLSRTGGNKWFENKGVKGLLFYDNENIEEFVNNLNVVNDLKCRGLLGTIKSETRSFFRKEFNMQTYIDNYIILLKKLNEEI